MLLFLLLFWLDKPFAWIWLLCARNFHSTSTYCPVRNQEIFSWLLCWHSSAEWRTFGAFQHVLDDFLSEGQNLLFSSYSFFLLPIHKIRVQMLIRCIPFGILFFHSPSSIYVSPSLQSWEVASKTQLRVETESVVFVEVNFLALLCTIGNIFHIYAAIDESAFGLESTFSMKYLNFRFLSSFVILFSTSVELKWQSISWHATLNEIEFFLTLNVEAQCFFCLMRCGNIAAFDFI